jgi:very-short-patch-repair endonuclease
MDYWGKKELVKRARVLRSNMTKAEIILWSRLRSKKVDGYKFRRQQPIYNYIVDFFCHKLKLIVEVDGEIHSLSDISKYDAKRDKILKLNGYHIIRLSNHEVETEIDSSITKIKSYIQKNIAPPEGTKVIKSHENKSIKNGFVPLPE